MDLIIEETINEGMSLISGIPPWVQMYFDKNTGENRSKYNGGISEFLTVCLRRSKF